MDTDLSIGDVVDRTGVTASALRFYERRSLIHAARTEGGQRRYRRDVLRRVAFIRVAQRVGLTLEDISDALAVLPDRRTPQVADWERLSRAWRDRLDERITLMQALRDELSSCIGCGCLSLKACSLYNPSDAAARLGPGPRYMLGDSALDAVSAAPNPPQD